MTLTEVAASAANKNSGTGEPTKGGLSVSASQPEFQQQEIRANGIAVSKDELAHLRTCVENATSNSSQISTTNTDVSSKQGKIEALRPDTHQLIAETSAKLTDLLERFERRVREPMLASLHSEYSDKFMDFYRRHDSDLGIHLGVKTLEAFDKVFSPDSKTLDRTPLREVVEEVKFYALDENVAKEFEKGCELLDKRLTREIEPALESAGRLRRNLELQFALGAVKDLSYISDKVAVLQGGAGFTSDQKTEMAEGVINKYDNLASYKDNLLRASKGSFLLTPEEFKTLSSSERKELREIFKTLENQAGILKREFNALLERTENRSESVQQTAGEAREKIPDKFGFPIKDQNKEIRYVVDQEGNSFLEVTATQPHRSGFLRKEQQGMFRIQVGEAETPVDDKRALIAAILGSVEELKNEKVFSDDGRYLNTESAMFCRLLALDNRAKLAVVTNLKIEELDLSGQDARGIVLDNVQVNRFIAIDAEFQGSRWSRVVAKNGTFEGTSFEGAKITRCDFSGSDMIHGSLKDAEITKTRMRNVNALETELHGVKFDFDAGWLQKLRARHLMGGMVLSEEKTDQGCTLRSVLYRVDYKPYFNDRLTAPELLSIIDRSPAFTSERVEGFNGQEALLVHLPDRRLLVERRGGNNEDPEASHGVALWSVERDENGRLRKRMFDDLDRIVNSDTKYQDAEELFGDLCRIARQNLDQIKETGTLTHRTWGEQASKV